jgi:hypothetical protein
LQSSGATPARFLVTLRPAALETFFGAAAAANDAGDRGDVFTTLGGDELRVLGPPLAETHPK